MPFCTCGDGSIDVTGAKVKVQKRLEIRDSERLPVERQFDGIPFLLSVTIVLTTGKSGCETRDLRFTLGVTRQLLFLRISEGVKQVNYCQHLIRITSQNHGRQQQAFSQPF